MSKLARRIKRSVKEIDIGLSFWDKFSEKWDDFTSYLANKTKYYEINYFLHNLPHFIKQAWEWRGFDSSYTITTFHQNLELLGKQLNKYNNHTMSMKLSRECRFAAYLLKQAYDESARWGDKSLKNWFNNNKMDFKEIKKGGDKGLYKTVWKRRYPEDYAQKMSKIIDKRINNTILKRKEFVWNYIQKNIERWWD